MHLKAYGIIIGSICTPLSGALTCLALLYEHVLVGQSWQSFLLRIPKLFQWLIAGCMFVAVWIGLLLGYMETDMHDSTKDVILFLPVFVALIFAFYSVAVIGYRVATFNDCAKAAEELQIDISDARKDLSRKGFKFD